MAIRTVVTRGFGNGTFSGTIALVVTRGYAIAEEAPLTLDLIYAAEGHIPTYAPTGHIPTYITDGNVPNWKPPCQSS